MAACMKVLVIFDGSDDGFDGLQNLTRLLPALRSDNHFTLAVVGWPQRPSPIWDLALERQRAVDDLHRAMAEVANLQLKRLSDVFSPLGTIVTEYLDGDPTIEIVALARRMQAEMIIGGITRGERARTVNQTALAILEHTSVPAIFAFGPLPVRTA